MSIIYPLPRQLPVIQALQPISEVIQCANVLALKRIQEGQSDGGIQVSVEAIGNFTPIPTTLDP